MLAAAHERTLMENKLLRGLVLTICVNKQVSHGEYKQTSQTVGMISNLMLKNLIATTFGNKSLMQNIIRIIKLKMY